jgi:hypothetical protein
MNIPDIIKEAFAYDIANSEEYIERLGVKDGVEWLVLSYDEDLEIGFPTLYGLKKGKLKESYGFESLDIIDSLAKN